MDNQWSLKNLFRSSVYFIFCEKMDEFYQSIYNSKEDLLLKVVFLELGQSECWELIAIYRVWVFWKELKKISNGVIQGEGASQIFALTCTLNN